MIDVFRNVGPSRCSFRFRIRHNPSIISPLTLFRSIHFFNQVKMTFTKPPKAQLMSYRIGRGEQGVLTYEPYKSYLLPLWRFRTVPIARTSSEALWRQFLEFNDKDDFVGMDMTRKFIQMGMTRSKRYANYKGGRKYVDGKEKGNAIEKSVGHAGQEDKEEASKVFRAVWERCRDHKGYAVLKVRFLAEQKEWEKENVKIVEKDKMKLSRRVPRTRGKIEND